MLGPILRLDLPRRMANLKIPAVSVAATADGRAIETAAFGPVDNQTMFQAASISKAVFAVAVMRLHEQGRLDIDAPTGALRLHGWKVPVTLRQLLSHTAGANVHGFDGYPAGASLPTVEQILRGAPPANSPKVKLKRLPGTCYDYSGGGFVLAQGIVTDTLGLDFHTLLRDLVLEPCGMRHSTFEQELPPGARFASGYRADYRRVEGHYMRMPELAAAGLWTTPADLVRLSLELQRALRGESALLRREALEMMLTPVKGSYGLGFELEGDIFGHSGSNVGYKSYWRMGRRSGAVAFMVNAEGPGVSALLNELTDAIKAHPILT